MESVIPDVDVDTAVTFVGGADRGEAVILAVVPLSPASSGLICDVTPFYPWDPAGPGQPADTGTVSIDGTAYRVTDAVVGAIDRASGRLFLRGSCDPRDAALLHGW